MLVVVTTAEIIILAVNFLDDNGKPLSTNFLDFKNSIAFLASEPLFKVCFNFIFLMFLDSIRWFSS